MAASFCRQVQRQPAVYQAERLIQRIRTDSLDGQGGLIRFFYQNGHFGIDNTDLNPQGKRKHVLKNLAASCEESSTVRNSVYFFGSLANPAASDGECALCCGSTS